MRIIKYESKSQGVTKLIDALEIEDNNIVMLGTFDGFYGLDYRIGKSLQNYRRCDFREILKFIRYEDINTSSDLQQFMFDMFMGALVYLTQNTITINHILQSRDITENESSALIEYFKIFVTSQPEIPYFKMDDISVGNYLSNFRVSSKPARFKGSDEDYNTLNLYAYERESTKRERDWIDKEGVFDVSKPWKNLRVIPSEIESTFKGKKIGTLYFTEGTLLLHAKYNSDDTFISYNLPSYIYYYKKYYDGFYKGVIDSLLAIGNYYSSDIINNIESYVVLDEVMEKYVQSLSSNKFESMMQKAVGSMNQ